MRRLAPRPLAAALEGVRRDSAPRTRLAAVQAAWPGVAGPGLATVASPVSEREGVVTVACESGAWAQELELLGPDLLERLNAALDGAPIAKFRFVVGSVPNRP